MFSVFRMINFFKFLFLQADLIIFYKSDFYIEEAEIGDRDLTIIKGGYLAWNTEEKSGRIFTLTIACHSLFYDPYVTFIHLKE